MIQKKRNNLLPSHMQSLLKYVCVCVLGGGGLFASQSLNVRVLMFMVDIMLLI